MVVGNITFVSAPEHTESLIKMLRCLAKELSSDKSGASSPRLARVKEMGGESVKSDTPASVSLQFEFENMNCLNNWKENILPDSLNKFMDSVPMEIYTFFTVLDVIELA
jgi:hypothetical protein